MTAPEFSLVLECQPPAVTRDLLRDLVAQVLGSVGCSGDIERAVAGIEAAMNGRAPHDTLELVFRCQDGELSIAVSSGASPVWRTACALP